MFAKLRPRLTYANVMATIAVFIAVSTGSAYAANTVFSTDIVDGEVKTPDLASGAVGQGKLAANSVITGKVVDDSLGAVDLAPGSVGTSEVADGGIQGVDVKNNTLTDAQVDEPTLFNDDSLTTKDIDENALFNDNSLTGDDISNSSTLGGNEINESTLNTVPSAAKVGHGSLDLINFHASNGSGGSGTGSIGGGGGLGVTFSCAVATGDLSLSLRTAVDNASLAVSDDDSYFDVEDFDVATGDVDILTPLGGDSDEIINFVYVDGSGFGIHKTVTGQIHVLDQAPAGTQSECVVAGHAIFTVL